MEQRDAGRPGDHPGPPANLADLPLPIREVDHEWVRVHKARRDPIYFGSSGSNRFDAPNGAFGVMYVGKDAHCAIVETIEFLSSGRLIAASTLSHLSLTRIQTDRPLRLVDLTADGLVRLGADARLTTGSYAISQQWSLAIWNHPSTLDGLLYRSRHDPSRMSAAIFNRASDAISATRIGPFVADDVQQILRRIFADYGFVLIED
jgi:hypothetical protein